MDSFKISDPRFESITWKRSDDLFRSNQCNLTQGYKFGTPGFERITLVCQEAHLVSEQRRLYWVSSSGFSTGVFQVFLKVPRCYKL